MVDNKITILKLMFKKMACAGNDFTSLMLPAPKYCEMIVEIALRVCPNTQINMDKNDPTIPAAARDSMPSISILPTIAVSVKESKGSAMPAIVAGIANLLMLLNVIEFFNGTI